MWHGMLCWLTEIKTLMLCEHSDHFPVLYLGIEFPLVFARKALGVFLCPV